MFVTDCETNVFCLMLKVDKGTSVDTKRSSLSSIFFCFELKCKRVHDVTVGTHVDDKKETPRVKDETRRSVLRCVERSL